MTCYELHPDLDTLELQLIGQLSEADNAEVEKHVLMCEPCQQMAQALNQQLQAIRVALKVM